ncbi:hypothetical protein [Flagellimonas amoyensis]|uniref:hypothetical protein n=1 Tax=Flagellimonas amoyensis TaxID=2169401 RepID=UPI000D3BAC36|nr:hypothetical protein [Allomuricauda amoyensis]
MKKIIKFTLLGILAIVALFAINFFTIKKLDANYLHSESLFLKQDSTPPPHKVPSHFLDGARFLVKIPMANNDTILGFCDSGGGLSMLMPFAKNTSSISDKTKKGFLKGVMPMEYILFGDLTNDPKFPAPMPMRYFALRKPFSLIDEPYLIVPPEDEELKMFADKLPMMKVFLGQGFFMGKSWTLNYIDQEIWVNTPLDEDPKNDHNIQKIGFKKNDAGIPIYGHPSMKIQVEGETIDVLFDTGATFVLSENGQKLLQTNKSTLAGSFIAASIFDKWQKNHPDWKVYPESDMSRDIIEVPLVKIGEFGVGPVLFSKRPDENWSKGMIQSMDKVVKGAIGGSALKHFKVTIDYNSELIKFGK